GGDLRGHNTRENLRAIRHDGCRGLVATGFDAKNQHAVDASIGARVGGKSEVRSQKAEASVGQVLASKSEALRGCQHESVASGPGRVGCAFLIYHLAIRVTRSQKAFILTPESRILNPCVDAAQTVALHCAHCE